MQMRSIHEDGILFMQTPYFTPQGMQPSHNTQLAEERQSDAREDPEFDPDEDLFTFFKFDDEEDSPGLLSPTSGSDTSRLLDHARGLFHF